MECLPNRKSQQNGMTLIEVTIAMAIALILTGTFVMTWAGSKRSDDINKTTQRIFDDLVVIRSRAVSVNQRHRLNFSADNSWAVEALNEATSTWEQVGELRGMPSGINLTATTFSNSGTNLEADTNGLYEFKNGAIGTPYVTIEGFGYSYTRSIEVAVGGALAFRTN